jgi:hypothetical protein
MPKTQTIKKKLTTRAKITIGFVSLVILIIGIGAYSFTGFGYTVYRIKCGHKPVIQVGGFGETSSTYIGPDDPMYIFYFSNGGSKYFCTERQAQAQGLSKDQ